MAYSMHKKRIIMNFKNSALVRVYSKNSLGDVKNKFWGSLGMWDALLGLLVYKRGNRQVCLLAAQGKY